MNKFFSVIGIIIVPILLWAQDADRSLSVDEVIARMTLEQKAKLVVGVGMRFPGAPQPGGPVVGQTEDRVPGAAGSTFSIPDLNIPGMVVADGPAGLRISPLRRGDSTNTYYATAFPIATLLACTWDTTLIQKVGYTIGKEVLEYGVDIILMPALNLHRNPLCGRNFEYYSEDPLLTGSMTAAMVRGIQAQGVGTSIKHFAANNQETNRNNINTIVSERALREIYLKGYEIAVKHAAPWTVMSSYNKINGVYASESYDLLTTVLRDDWGFTGFVMTDWFGGKDPVAQMRAGNDLLMPGRPRQSQALIDSVNNGVLDIQILDTNVKRILNVIRQSPTYKGYKYSDKPDLKAHAQIARMTATEGMVLLKNDNNVLPINTKKKIALFGNASYDIVIGGTGSGDVNEAYSISLEQGLANEGFSTDDKLKNTYLSYIEQEHANHPRQRRSFRPPPPVPPMPVSDSLINAMVAKTDLAVITIGRISGEFSDRKLEEDYHLVAAEREMIQSVSDAYHVKNKKVVIVLNIGGVIETASWRDKADGIVLAWQPGQEAGNAIADVLIGKVNPSGKLADTFPINYQDVPSAKNFPGAPADRPDSVIYEEGIYVGYRYYNTFNIKPAYEFGYGLSYTSFDYSKVKLNSKKFKDALTARVTITNTGKAAGKEVVQVYISAPANRIAKPISELRAFAKTKLLQPGDSQTLSFILTAKDLASFDTASSSWIAEKGDYTLKVGASSMDIKRTVKFKVSEDLVVEEVNKALSPRAEINELKK
jgi:beta-glucosidase